MQVRYEKDADPALIRAKKVAVIGYGAQGHAHALNLRDAGVNVIVALQAGARREAQARGDGFEIVSVAEATQRADVLVMCAPDEVMPDLYAAEIAPHLRDGQTLMFVHGFAVHFGFISAPAGVDVAMVAPKGPGKALREAFTRGGGLPCIVAVSQDASGGAGGFGVFLWRRDWMRARGHDRVFVQDRDGRGSLLRAGRALRRAHAFDPHRVGGAGGSRNAAGARVFRLLARSEIALGFDP